MKSFVVSIDVSDDSSDELIASALRVAGDRAARAIEDAPPEVDVALDLKEPTDNTDVYEMILQRTE